MNDLQQVATGKRQQYAKLSPAELLEKLLSSEERESQLAEKLTFFQNKFFEDSRMSQRLAKVEAQTGNFLSHIQTSTQLFERVMERIELLETSARARADMEGI